MGITPLREQWPRDESEQNKCKIARRSVTYGAGGNLCRLSRAGAKCGAGGEGAVGADRQGRELLTYPTKGSGPCCEGGTLNLREW